MTVLTFTALWQECKSMWWVCVVFFLPPNKKELPLLFIYLFLF